MMTVERTLFDMATYLHRRDAHNQHFERCEHERCLEVRRILDIKGFLHRFDDPEPDRDCSFVQKQGDLSCVDAGVEFNYQCGNCQSLSAVMALD